MHQIRFRFLGSLQCSPDLLAGYKGPTFKERGKRNRRGRREEGTGGKGEGAWIKW